MDLYNIRKIWHPDWYQGNRRKKSYFEGWYFKLVNRNATASWAIIPGISHGSAEKDSYPFIQVINGQTGVSNFIRYRLEDFTYSRSSFSVSIARNHFSKDGIVIDIDDGDLKISGEISFRNPILYPVKFLSPGVMGWYRFIPTMECYHGIVSMLHDLEGSLAISGSKVNFSGGKGYIEKDWGKSMPLAWIWLQSNHFNREDLSASFSIANIPWRKSAFTGFLIILSAGDRYYRFTTYNGSRITKLLAKDDHIIFEAQNRHYFLRVNAHGEARSDLRAPVAGEMSRIIHESTGSRVSITLTNRDGTLILEDSGEPAGMEIAGDVRVLQRDITS